MKAFPFSEKVQMLNSKGVKQGAELSEALLRLSHLLHKTRDTLWSLKSDHIFSFSPSP